jgi:DNA polymerase-3 subunit epsilon
MRLREIEFLFIDCQTTGMRPSNGRLLELAWTTARAEDQDSTLHSSLIRLPEGEAVPARVSEITGIRDADLAQALSEEEWFTRFAKAVRELPAPKIAVVHYAQFEKPFLADLYSRFAGGSELPFRILCSQQLSKRLCPSLPSQNIRAAAGYFGAESLDVSGIKRAGAHVRATQTIWRGLVRKFAEAGVEDLEALDAWLRDVPKQKSARYEYRLDKLKRLDLPNEPGVYRMLSKAGVVLYVGKATSLKSRVNSYFRGQKNRDRFKLEMLAQVWDLDVTRCKTALEAALLESDEIKRLEPPYNTLLKRGRRHLVFYSRDLLRVGFQQSAEFPLGPFRNSNWIESLRLLHRSLEQGEFLQIFFEPLPPEDLRAGFLLFLERQGLIREDLRGVRSLLALGLHLHRHHVEPEEAESENPEEEETADDSSADERPPTPEEIADKFERLLRRAAVERLRGKKLTRLLNADVQITTPEGVSRLHFHHGRLNAPTPAATDWPWQGLDVADFDRMSILLSELAKYEHSLKTES